ncbi:MAG TPA: hypothetical protein PLU02_16090, partial [Chitinophagales bacterium]|nr:hypothetical protein [Chitinophagales bacterium]
RYFLMGIMTLFINMSYSQLYIKYDEHNGKVKSGADLWQFNCINTSSDSLLCDITILLTDASGKPLYFVNAHKVKFGAKQALSGKQLYEYATEQTVTENELSAILKQVKSMCVSANHVATQFEIVTNCRDLQNGMSDTSKVVEAFTKIGESINAQVAIAQYVNLKPENESGMLLKPQFSGYANFTTFGVPFQLQFYNAYAAEIFGFKPAMALTFDSAGYKQQLTEKMEDKLAGEMHSKGLNYEMIYAKLTAYEGLQSYFNNFDSLLVDSLTAIANVKKSEYIAKAQDSLYNLSAQLKNNTLATYDSVNNCFNDDNYLLDSVMSIENSIGQLAQEKNGVDSLIGNYQNLLDLNAEKENLYQQLYEDSTVASYVKQIEQINAIKSGEISQFAALIDTGKFAAATKVISNVNDFGAGKIVYNVDAFLLENVSISGAVLDYQINEYTSVFGLGGFMKDEFDYYTAVNSLTNTNRIIAGGIKREIGQFGKYTMAMLDGRNHDTTIAYNQHWNGNNLIFNKYEALGLEDGLFDLEMSLGLSITSNDALENDVVQDANWFPQMFTINGAYIDNTFSGFATRISTTFHMLKWQSSCFVKHEFINKSYFTAGNPFLLTGLQIFETGWETKFEKIKTDIALGAIYNLFFKEVDNTKRTGFMQYKGEISSEITDDLHLSLNYYPNVIFLNGQKTVVSNLVGTVSYTKAIQSLPVTSILTYAQTNSSQLDAENTAIHFQQHMAIGMVNMSINKHLSTGVNMQFAALAYDSNYTTLSVGQNVVVSLADSWEIMGDYSLPIKSNINTEMAYRLNAGYLFKKIKLGAEVMKMEYNMLNAGLENSTMVVWGNVYCTFNIN